MVLPDRESHRIRPFSEVTWRTHALNIGQVVQTLALLLFIVWIVYQGVSHIQYRWQWYRTLPFLFRIVDGEIIWGPLAKGLMETLKISLIAGVLTIIVGLATAFARLSNSFAGRIIATAYLELIRNTPLLVQLFLFYFVLSPIFGIERFWSGVLCLTAFEGSFAAEIIRAGIQGVDKGQFETADALGFTVVDKYRLMIIPQALPLIIPPMTGLLISLIKHSAIVSVIAISELTTAGLNLISDTFMAFEVWFMVAGIYLALTITLSFAVTLLESRVAAKNYR